ncbi:MAG: hypothetical protein GX434_10120 [Peptococcaceae bacterium]|nr:hypothetical protein [Peptococcaceae bacterium]
MELPRRKRARKNQYDKELYPQGILDIIEADYPDRYVNLSDDLETLFSEEEWIDILTKSRLSHEQLIKLKKQGKRNIK